MILGIGDRVLISHRRIFEKDQPRFFTGKIDLYEHGVARVTGYSWHRDQLAGKVHKKPDLRTKVISIASGTFLVYLLPESINLEDLVIHQAENGDILLTDGNKFIMDITERFHQ